MAGIWHDILALQKILSVWSRLEVIEVSPAKELSRHIQIQDESWLSELV